MTKTDYCPHSVVRVAAEPDRRSTPQTAACDQPKHPERQPHQSFNLRLQVGEGSVESTVREWTPLCSPSTPPSGAHRVEVDAIAGVEPRIHPVRFSLTSAQVKEKRTASTVSTRAHSTALPPPGAHHSARRLHRCAHRPPHRCALDGHGARTGWTRCAHHRTGAHRVGALHSVRWCGGAVSGAEPPRSPPPRRPVPPVRRAAPAERGRRGSGRQRGPGRRSARGCGRSPARPSRGRA